MQKVKIKVIFQNLERKIKRHKRILEAKKARRKKKKEHRKEKLAELKKAGLFTQVIQRKNKNLARERMRKVIGEAPRVCIDLSFGSMMSEKELHRLSSQLRRLYGSNQNSIKPVHLFFTSFGNENPLYKICCDKNDGFLNYVVDMTDKYFLEIFDSEEVVYLTPDSSNVLERLETDKVYIIGGLVDENINKNVTLNTAESKQLVTARLPIEEYMKRANRGSYCKVLAINQVVDILLKYYITGEWSEALIAGVPTRKGFLPNTQAKET